MKKKWAKKSRNDKHYIGATIQNPIGKEIKSEANVKELGVIKNEKHALREHIDKMVLSSQVMSGMIFTTFITRDRQLMMNILSVYIRRKNLTCVVWSPTERNQISCKDFCNTLQVKLKEWNT